MTERSRAEICADIGDLVRERGFLYALATMLRRDLFLDPAEAADIDWHARLSYQEFTFLTGLLVKESVSLDRPSEEELTAQMTRTTELFTELHDAHGVAIMKRMALEANRAQQEGLSFEESSHAFFGAGDVMTEAIFYSGSGAFDFQYWALAPQRYALDAGWLRSNKQLDLQAASDIAQTLKDLRDPFLDQPPKTFESFLDAVLAMFCVSPDEITGHSSTDVEAFFRAFALVPGTVNEDLLEPGQYNSVDSHPLIELDDGRFFCPVHFNLARSLYESPFYWMLADSSYSDAASAHRGEVTEQITATFLEDVFGAAQVFRNVELRRNAVVVGEIDVLAVVGRKGLIVQCKSKRLTELARRGDTDRLKSDFAGAVQAAYDQGLSCRDLLRDATVDAVRADGVTLDVEIDDAFILCVVSDHYPSLAHQIHAYLERPSEDPYPLAVSTFDLELLSHYLSDPLEFLYYVRQRTRLAEYFRADEEMSLLAFHLKHKLYATPGADLIAVTHDMGQLIDANYPVVRGQHPETPAAKRLFHEWKNEHYDRLVEDLKLSGEPGFVDAILMLFDLSGDGIDAIVEQIQLAKALSRGDGKKHSVATLVDSRQSGISFVTRLNDYDQLQRDNLSYAVLKKHQTRAPEWLGLGSLAGSERLADVVVFNSEPWQEDATLDALVNENLGGGTMKRLSPKVGRNDPCYCGSGLKFKRCHGRTER